MNRYQVLLLLYYTLYKEDITNINIKTNNKNIERNTEEKKTERT